MTDDNPYDEFPTDPAPAAAPTPPPGPAPAQPGEQPWTQPQVNSPNDPPLDPVYEGEGVPLTVIERYFDRMTTAIEKAAAAVIMLAQGQQGSQAAPAAPANVRAPAPPRGGPPAPASAPPPSTAPQGRGRGGRAKSPAEKANMIKNYMSGVTDIDPSWNDGSLWNEVPKAPIFAKKGFGNMTYAQLYQDIEARGLMQWVVKRDCEKLGGKDWPNWSGSIYPDSYERIWVMKQGEVVFPD